MPIAVLNTRTAPNIASCNGPTTTITTNIAPRSALNRVQTFARTIWASVRLGATTATLAWPATRRDSTSREVSPSGAIEEALAAKSPLRSRSDCDGVIDGIVATEVQPEGWVLVRHQGCVRDHAQHPAVAPENEVEERARVCARDCKCHCGDQHENADQSQTASVVRV